MALIKGNQLFAMSRYTFDRLAKEKNGADAFMLYTAYMRQSTMQETDKSWSYDVFMIKINKPLFNLFY